MQNMQKFALPTLLMLAVCWCPSPTRSHCTVTVTRDGGTASASASASVSLWQQRLQQASAAPQQARRLGAVVVADVRPVVRRADVLRAFDALRDRQRLRLQVLDRAQAAPLPARARLLRLEPLRQLPEAPVRGDAAAPGPRSRCRRRASRRRWSRARAAAAPPRAPHGPRGTRARRSRPGPPT